MGKVSGTEDYHVLGFIGTAQEGFGVLLLVGKLGSFKLCKDWKKRDVGCGWHSTRNECLDSV
jgi:hypothetical protein